MPVNFAPGWQAKPSTIGDALLGLGKAFDTFAGYKNEERDWKMKLDEVARKREESEQMRKVRDLEMEQYRNNIDTQKTAKAEEEATLKAALPTGTDVVAEKPVEMKTGGALSTLVSGAAPAAPKPIDLSSMLAGAPAAPAAPAPVASVAQPPLAQAAQTPVAKPVQPAAQPEVKSIGKLQLFGRQGPLSPEERVQGRKNIVAENEKKAAAIKTREDELRDTVISPFDMEVAGNQVKKGDRIPNAIYQMKLAEIAAGHKAEAAPTTKNIGGREKGWNPKTQRFDIDFGPAGSPKDTSGGVSPVDFEALVETYRSGDMQGNELGRSGIRARVIAEATRREREAGNKAFSPQTAEQRKKMRADYAASGPGTAGGQLDSLNQLASHMEILEESAKGLKNKDTRAVNRIINYAKTQLGMSDVTDYQTASLAVAEEVARLLKGGVAGENEGEAWLKKYDPNASLEQQMGAIEKTKHLVRGRVSSKRVRWNAIMGKDHAPEFDNFLDPTASAFFGLTSTDNADKAAGREGAAPEAATSSPVGQSDIEALIKKHGGK